MFTFPVAHFSAADGSFAVDNTAVFNDDDAEYLTFLPSSAPTSDRICTFSFWVKRGSVGNAQKIITQGQESGGVAESIHIYFHSDDRFIVLCETAAGAATINRTTTQVFRDPHAWMHFCIRIDGSQTDDTACIVEVNGSAIASADFDTKTNPSSSTDLATFNNVKALNIGRLERSASGTYGDYYLGEFVGIDGTALAASNFGEYDTNGVWRPISIEDASLTFGNNGFYLPFTNSGGLGQDYSGSTSTNVVQKNTYNAGSEINDGDAGANPSTGMLFIPPATGTVSKIELNASSRGFSGVTVRLETDGGSGTAPSGTIVTNGEVTGITSSGAGMKTATFSTPPEVTAGVKYWIVLRGDTGTWGLQHDVSGVGGALGLYQGGQGYFSGRGVGHNVYMTGNHFGAVNHSPTQTTDTCTDNHCVMSPIFAASTQTLSEGNLKVVGSTSNEGVGGTHTLFNGAYWEVKNTVNGAASGQRFGVASADAGMHHPSSGHGGGTAGNHTYHVWDQNNTIYQSNNAGAASAGTHTAWSSFTTGDVISFHVDGTNLKVRKNNDSFDTIISSFTATDWMPFIETYNGTVELRFQADDWTQTLPTGAKAINTTNQNSANSPAIEDGSAHHQTTIWEGSSSISVPRLISQSGHSKFKPDWVWGKNRDNSGYAHRLFDAVRGATKVLQLGGTAGIDPEATDANGVTDFEATGFDIGNGVHLNGNNESIVAWQWLAGNGTSPNTQGRKASDSSVITSTVSVNQTAGFSIVSWQGNDENSTIGHGLNAIPKMIIVKNRDSAGNNWAVYHVGQGNTHVSFLDSSNGAIAADRWQDTTPDANVFSVDGTTDVNKSGDDMIAYCWAEVPGYSKFGTFEGNGSSTDGPFIHLGFKPAWFMWKNIDSGTNGDWTIMDAARDPFNMVEDNLRANSTMASDTGEADLDFLSNGVKHRGGALARFNASATYIYAAFASSPFAGSSPATAE